MSPYEEPDPSKKAVATGLPTRKQSGPLRTCKLTPADRKIWPTPSRGPSHDFTFEGEQFVAIAGDWESNYSAVVPAIATIVRERPEVRTILHLGDLRFEAPILVNGKLRSRTFVRDLDALLARHGIDRLLLTPGNHDWWEQLYAEFVRHPGRPYRIATRIWALPRGFRFRIGTAEFMSFGGAASLDKGPRRSGWSQHEAPTQSEVTAAATGIRVDVLLTHEAPDAGVPEVDALTKEPRGWAADRLEASSSSRKLITDLVRAVDPRLTFHGHMHVSGEAHTPTKRSTYSLSLAGTPRNVGILDVSAQTFSWLPLPLFRPSPAQSLATEKGPARRPQLLDRLPDVESTRPVASQRAPARGSTLRRIGALLLSYNMDLDAFANAIEVALLVEGAPRSPAPPPRSFSSDDAGLTAAAEAVASGSFQTRAATNLAEIVATSDSIPHAAKTLGLSVQALDRQIRAGEAHTIEVGGARRVPVWQYTDDSPPRLLPHLKQILTAAAAEGMTGTSLASFMTRPQQALRASTVFSARRWLASGKRPELVVDLLHRPRFL